MWFSYDFGTSTVAVKSLLWLGITEISRSWPLSIAFFIKISKNWSKVIQPWYPTGSSRPELPDASKISCWLDQFSGKLAIHPGVGVAQLTISKFLRNPPSSCPARHPPAFGQLEYCWLWNFVEPPIDPILFGQLRASAVERAHNNGCWPWATW